MKHAGRSRAQGGRVAARAQAVAAGLDAVKFHFGVVVKGREEADGVGTAADTGDQRVGVPTLRFFHLPNHLPADDALKLPYQPGVGVGPDDGPEAVKRRSHVRDPVPHGLVDRVFERAGSGGHGNDLGPHAPHAKHVERLAFDVLGAHVNFTGQAQPRAGGGGANPVLARAGLGDDALFPQPLGQKDLPERVVDFVGAGVAEVLALQIDPGPAQALGQIFGEKKRGRPSGEFCQKVVQLFLKRRVPMEAPEGRFQFFQGRHEGFGNEPPAVVAEVPAAVGEVFEFHANFTTSKNFFILS